jgi:hypothetical protein
MQGANYRLSVKHHDSEFAPIQWLFLPLSNDETNQQQQMSNMNSPNNLDGNRKAPEISNYFCITDSADLVDIEPLAFLLSM